LLKFFIYSQLNQNKMEKTIWLVFENGAGIMHKAFENRVDALALVEVLKAETGFEDAFDIVPITYQY